MTTLTTQELIAVLDRLDKEAKVAPWRVEHIPDEYKTYIYSGEEHQPYIAYIDTDMPDEVPTAELIVTLRNNLNTIVRWGRVVEAAKQEIGQLDPHDHYPFIYKTRHALSLIEE